MGGMPVTDPTTGKVLCWDWEKQSFEWCNFSEAIEERMEFDEGTEDDVASATEEDRRAFEADYDLPDHFLDDHDRLFRCIAFAHFLYYITKDHPSTSHEKDDEMKRIMINEFMVGEFKDWSLDDFVYEYVADGSPDLAEVLFGEEA
ncbi:MAG: hypothetical protein IIY98_03785 [Aeriscardovia sp.]|nr:hypothetical protein [Aeriscardovia sp.]